jgi:hypothetical protein
MQSHFNTTPFNVDVYHRISLILPGCRGWKGHHWAEPSEEHLRLLLREIYTSPEVAKQKGIAARQRMLNRYSIPVFSDLLMTEIKRIVKFVEGVEVVSSRGHDSSSEL